MMNAGRERMAGRPQQVLQPDKTTWRFVARIGAVIP
tara:strand:+ start:6926 stop:7033 length:108 start_codon:yes stop_codon:yes gene_type:complete